MTRDTAPSDKLASLSLEKRKLLERLLHKDLVPSRVPRAHRREGRSGQAQTAPAGTQQRLWFIDRLEGGSLAYHIPLALRLRGDLDYPALQAALDALIDRHEALRTVFPEVDGAPVQEILDPVKFGLQRLDLSDEEPERRMSEVHSQVQAELSTPFNLSVGPLIRGRLLRLSASEHVLLIVVHHIVADGWSVAVLLRELAALYCTDRRAGSDPLPALPAQYADYVQWQREASTDVRLRQRLEYWQEHLRAAPTALELPSDRPRPPVQSYRGAAVNFALGVDLTKQLKGVSRRFDCTLVMTLLTAWSILLGRLSGQNDVVVGMPVANRRRVEFEGLIGFFASTLAARIRMDDDPPLSDLLHQAKQTLVAAYANQDVPFERVVEALQPVRSLSHSPIFQAMFAFQNDPPVRIELPELTLIEEEVPLHTAKFDLTLTIRDSADGLVGSINYATDLFDELTIGRWAGHFESVLRAMAGDSQQRVSAVRLLKEDERRQLLETFNATQASYPRERLIHELFEEQVERTPHEVAVISGGEHLTYRQLNCRANQLARYLRQQGAGPERFVGLCTERGIDMVVGLLGILKSGGAYVPLDPNYPQHRLEYMLEDTTPIAVLTQEHLKDRLPEGHKIVGLDTQWSEIAQHAGTNPGRASSEASSRNLAYVIYTSGSTGRPKGVAIEHRNAVNMICWAQSAMHEEVFEQTLQSTSLNFDLSVYECFVPLASGGSLRVVQNALALASELHAKVTLINTVPSAISSLLEVGGVPASTRVVNLAGEALKKELVERIFAQTTVECVSNLYGPSETTTYSTWITMPREEGFNATVGHPVANTQVYILDRHLQPVPLGVVGEIYIGGDGVARGYLNRPELTAERFIADPFSAETQARMYKTGDLGRWRADGTIEYLGRNDHQVKIRGFRIELGEIETRLVGHEQVKEAVVLAREDVPGEKRLVAYVVAREPAQPPSVEALRAHLKETLPEHMVPSAFVVLERMPLTPNGKLDRRALPAPELGAYISRQYEAPQGEVEEILAGIWQSLLRVERVGRQDNFFELGGHSLLIVQVMERLRRVGLSTELRRVFDSSTLAQLASALRRGTNEQYAVPPNLIPEGCEAITPEMLPLVELEARHIERIVQTVAGGAANIQDIYPLVPLQEGILFHHLFDDQRGDTYVLPIVLLVSSRARLDELIAALQAVIDRHDVLRTAVLWEELPRPVQVVYRRAMLPVREVALQEDRSHEEQIQEWISPQRQRLDIRQAPLLRLQVAEDRGSGQWYALLQLHHMTSDHMTLEIITGEIVAHLQARAQALPSSLPYRNHVAQALAYAREHDAEEFFRGKLQEIEEPSAPFGLLDVHGDGSQVEEAREDLDADLTQRIRTQARRMEVSAATLFHAAWGLVTAHTSGRDDVVFGSVLLGRMHSSAGAQRTLGMFINTLPLRLRLRDVTAKELVEHTQRELIELLTHEQASLAAAQRCSGVVSSTPLFTTLLNYRHSVPNPDAEWSSARDISLLAWHEWTNYPITLSVDDAGDSFALSAQTDRQIDPRMMIGYLRTALGSLVEALEQAPQTVALSLAILPDHERHQLLQGFNATQASYPRERLIHELFEEQVERTPDVVAIDHDNDSLTYAELNQRANRLARILREAGVCPDAVVGICLDRGIEMIVSLLAALKAGGAYLPLDPNYPPERLQYMVRDAAPTVVLIHERLRRSLDLALESGPVIDPGSVSMTHGDGRNLPSSAIALNPDHLLYLIYTSGSTGRPKGAGMPHRAMVNLIEWHRRSFKNNHASKVLQFAALSFDVAFQETFSTLCTGGTLVLVDEWVRKDARSLVELLAAERVERLFVPPLMLQSLAECFGSAGAPLLQLRDIITAGEQLRISPEIVALFGHLHGCRLHNHYGPTETHVVTALTLTGNAEQWPAFPSIGAPIDNARIYILDQLRQPVPFGVVGEIYIGGVAVARGYRGRTELTKQRFLPDPFDGDASSRMYKTGDLGRWLADGTIEYLGRNDDQVKLRGFRIEIGEIEAQLAAHEGVKETAVLLREDAAGEKRLVAYVVPGDVAKQPTAEELRTHVRRALPEHMTPSAFVTLGSLPLTPSGKLNRRALPAPEQGAYVQRQYVAPEGAVEEDLTRIWGEVLQVQLVGRDDNFFELGGHSLLALKALLKVNEYFGAALRVVDAYQNPTVRELAARLQLGAMQDDRVVDLATEAALDPQLAPCPGSIRTPAKHILLTGATGFVGRFLLVAILRTTAATVHCLVRDLQDGRALSRLKESLLAWDLWADEFEHRIIPVPGDLKLPHLGVDEAAYEGLCRTVDAVYHCATSMNHLESYAMAKPANVDAAKEFVRFATRHRPKVINYVSTLGVFGAGANVERRVVNERSDIDDEGHRQSQGYLASKWVGEKIFMNAQARRIPCNIFRLGLVWADAARGRFDELQHAYRLLKSCLLCGYGIRNYRHPLPPVPVDYVVRAVVHLATRHSAGGGIFHISSPGQKIGGFFECCNDKLGASLQLVSMYEWIAQIRRLHRAGESLPIVPLIEFAFSMGEQAFAEFERTVKTVANIEFDCTRTFEELEAAGIIAPQLDEELLRTSLEGMLMHDDELRRWAVECSPGSMADLLLASEIRFTQNDRRGGRSHRAVGGDAA